MLRTVEADGPSSGSAGAGLTRLFGLFHGLRGFRREPRVLEEILRQVDEELSRGYSVRAESLIREGLRSVRGEAGYLSLFKRQLGLARMTGDYGGLVRDARGASKKLPGSRRLAAIAAYAAVRSEHPESAARILERSLRHPVLEGLQAEAELRGYAPARKTLRLDDSLRRLSELPGLSDPNDMHTLAGLLEEPRLDLDAALLWMRRGRVEEAFSVLWPHRGLAFVAEPLLFMAFDAGRYAEAWELGGALPELVEQPGHLILRGDVAWILGMPERAAAHYQQAIAIDPDYSWVPYLNLAELVASGGDSEGGRRMRAGAHGRFPVQSEVVLAHARDLAATGAADQARELIAVLIEGDPHDTTAQLLALELAGARSSPAVYQGRMWQLVNRQPDNPELVKSFALYLVGLRDIGGAAAVLAEYERSSGGALSPWFLELRGILALAQGDPERAAEYLGRSLVQVGEWRRRYNFAVVLMAGRRDEEALRELVQSETELVAAAAGRSAGPGGAQLQSYRSRIRSRIAEAQVNLGSREAARREALYALDLDSANQHARRVLRILEALR